MSNTDQTINQSTITEDVVRPTHVEVNLSRLRDNFNAIRNHVDPAKIMPILKANAYGHGMVRIAQLMEELGADYIGVAVLEEGILLRQSGIQMPILVTGGILGNQVPHFIEYDLTITASSIVKLEQIEEAALAMGKQAKVHLKIDTGMERIGVHYYSAESLLEKAASCKHMQVEGVFSHFARSEETDLSYTRLQLERFLETLSYYDKRGIEPPPLKHIANSGAILQMPETYLDMVRPGIMLYGVYPAEETQRTIEVKPALSWKSRVVYFKVIKPDHPVGYGSNWQSDHPIRAVTIPVGYGDGYFRSMSNKAKVLIRGNTYPVVGTISMDQIVANIEDGSAYNNDEVLLIGEIEGKNIRCEDLSEWAGTIPYEILTNINTRVPRIYISE
ncbi:alanine racemase [candidate division KSB1 bacterium]|nr:alanine racemase [candidate division KSB1 bacterium]